MMTSKRHLKVGPRSPNYEIGSQILLHDFNPINSRDSRHGGLPAKGKEVFVYTSGLEIEWTQMINSGFVVTGPLRTL